MNYKVIGRGEEGRDARAQGKKRRHGWNRREGLVTGSGADEQHQAGAVSKDDGSEVSSHNCLALLSSSCGC